MRYTILFFLSYLAIGCAPGPDRQIEDSYNETQNGIIGGHVTEATSDVARSTVYIDYQEKVDGKIIGSDCTGVIVNQTTILTAAHCVTRTRTNENTLVESKKAYIYFGADISKLKTVKYQIASSIIVHPKYKNSTWHNYDLAILKLDQPIPPPYKPVQILPDFFQLAIKAPVIAAGFGLTLVEPMTPANSLKHVELPISGIAQATLETRPSLNNTLCLGDSGGPLFFNFKGTIYLVGTYIGERGTADSKDCTGINVHTRLDALKDFLSPHVKWQSYSLTPENPM